MSAVDTMPKVDAMPGNDTLLTSPPVVVVQEGQFDAACEKRRLQQLSPETGAVVEFTGCVRADAADGQPGISGIFLEHYPGMTESAILRIIGLACSRWPLQGVTVIHRVGKLPVGDDIVYVGVASAHRQAAFHAAGFIMDYLKNDVPIWKKTLQASGGEWLSRKQSDVDAKNAWAATDDSGNGLSL